MFLHVLMEGTIVCAGGAILVCMDRATIFLASSVGGAAIFGRNTICVWLHVPLGRVFDVRLWDEVVF